MKSMPTRAKMAFGILPVQVARCCFRADSSGELTPRHYTEQGLASSLYRGGVRLGGPSQIQFPLPKDSSPSVEVSVHVPRLMNIPNEDKGQVTSFLDG